MGKRKPGSKKHAPLPQKISNKVGGATTTKQKKTTKPKPKGIHPYSYYNRKFIYLFVLKKTKPF